MPLPNPSRRTLIRTGAWTAPVIVAASAAPAFANSPGGLTVVDGSTRIAEMDDGNWGPLFEDFMIQSTAALEADELSVTVTVESPSNDASFAFYPSFGYGMVPAGWVTTTSQGAELLSLSFTYPTPVQANTPVTFDGALAAVVAQRSPTTDFTFTVVVSAPGATSVVRVFAYPG